MSGSPDVCVHCHKRVYHAELKRHDGKIFHSLCFAIWSKEDKKKDADVKNQRDYLKAADVTPAYYRVGDPSSGAGARMVTGPQERAEIGISIPGQAPPTSAQGAKCQCGKQLATSAKFCDECGAPVPPPRSAAAGCKNCGSTTATGRFCSECGQPI